MKNTMKKVGISLVVMAMLVGVGIAKSGVVKKGGIIPMIDPPGFITLIK